MTPRGEAGRARADPGMTPREMADLIRAAPPGPWPRGWDGWDATREAHLLLMRERIAAGPGPRPGGGGRGVVVSCSARPTVSAGNQPLPQGYLPGAWGLVKELRRLGCDLPVTFAHLGALEWDPALTRLVAPLGVSVLDLHDVAARDPRPPRVLGGWEGKCYAVLNAPYDEVLYLDADNFPLADLTPLFGWEPYRSLGSVWWPDVSPVGREEWLPDWVWRNVGLAYRDEGDFEAGQFLVDRRRCARELDLAMWMNEHSDYFYRFVHGDKSTFHLAWAVLGTRWAISPHPAVGHGASLLQHDFGGRALFQHMTSNKPSLAGYPSPDTLLKPAECAGHLAELRALWGGRLWDQTAPTPREAEWRGALQGQVYRSECGGRGCRPVRLLEDGGVGHGPARLEVRWAVWDVGGPLLVLLALDGGATATLRPDPAHAGAWRGRWLEYERCDVTLTPEGD